MSGEALPWVTAFFVVLAAVLMLVIALLLPRVTRVWSMTQRFYCPWRGRNVMVRYLTCDGRRAISVMSCTAFADPSVVTCGMPCLGRMGTGVEVADRHEGGLAGS